MRALNAGSIVSAGVVESVPLLFAANNAVVHILDLLLEVGVDVVDLFTLYREGARGTYFEDGRVLKDVRFRSLPLQWQTSPGTLLELI